MRVLQAMAAAAVLLASLPPASAGETETALRLDPNVTRHYEAACRAYDEGLYHRALAEIDLALTPSAGVYLDCPADSDLYKASLEGLRVWAEALGDESPFYVTKDPEEAMIHVVYGARLADREDDICGHVEWKRKAVYSRSSHAALVTARIQVATHTGAGEEHDRASLIHIVAHELGHVLGLDDTGDPMDIMGPDLHGKAATRLSGPELHAIRDFRQRCRDLQGNVLARAPQ